MRSTHQQRGFLLITTLTVIVVLMLIVSFYLRAIIQQTKLVGLGNLSPKLVTHSRAALTHAVQYITQDSSAYTQFTTNSSWTTSYTLDALTTGAQADISIQNIRAGDALIYATSAAAFQGITGTRVLQAYVFAPPETNIRPNTALFAHTDIDARGAAMSVIGGEVFANNDITLSAGSTWTSDSTVSAVDNIATSTSATLAAVNIYDQFNPPQPSRTEMIGIDFDDSDATSFAAVADAVYSSSAFAAAIASPATLTGITYVTGDAVIPRGASVIIDGLLVADGSISIGNIGTSTADTIFSVTHTDNEPSGIISRKNILIGPYNLSLDVHGLIYAANNILLTEHSASAQSVDITGAVVARRIALWPRADTITITYSDAAITDALNTKAFYPLVLTSVRESK